MKLQPRPPAGQAGPTVPTTLAVDHIERALRRISWAHHMVRTKYRRAFIASCIFGAPPYAIFLFLLIPKYSVHDSIHFWSFISAGLWLLISPGLIYLWDHRVTDMLFRIRTSPAREGWNTRLLDARCKSATRAFWPFTLFVVLVISVHFISSYDLYRGILAVRPRGSQDFFIDVATVAFMAWTFGVGIWGVFKTIALVDIVADPGLAYFPYEPEQINGIEHATGTFYMTGLLYSFGNVLTPAVLITFSQFDLLGRTIAVLVLLALELGGVACFLYTSIRLTNLARSQANAAIRRFADPLESWATDVDHGNLIKLSKEKDSIESVILLRTAAMQLASSPIPLNTLRRAATLILIPVVITFLQPIMSLIFSK